MIPTPLKGALALLLISALTGCGQSPTEATDSGRLQVVVTFDAVKEFAEAVGGDHVLVSKMIPDGMEAHDFEPKGKDLAMLSKADLFVYSGLGMETWVSEAIQSADNDQLTIIEAAKGFDAIPLEEDEDEHADEAPHDHEGVDPHVWISLSGAKYEAAAIRDGLIAADPANKADYEANYAEFSGQLDALYTAYAPRMDKAANKSFVTGHAAFAYLCRDFSLTQNSVSDVFAEGEPSAKQLIELIDYAKANRITTIFSEEMASPEVSKTLADEVGAKVETIYTMESSEDDLNYIDRMASNLEKIAVSLGE